jgi:hypothetical protein
MTSISETVTHCEGQSHDDSLHLTNSPYDCDSSSKSTLISSCSAGLVGFLRQTLEHLMEDNDDKECRPSGS